MLFLTIAPDFISLSAGLSDNLLLQFFIVDSFFLSNIYALKYKTISVVIN